MESAKFPAPPTIRCDHVGRRPRQDAPVSRAGAAGKGARTPRRVDQVASETLVGYRRPENVRRVFYSIYSAPDLTFRTNAVCSLGLLGLPWLHIHPERGSEGKKEQ